MKAMVMEEIGKPMVVKEWPEPKCPPDGAIVRVEGSGICRSDWHLWQGDWGWIGFKPRMPTILGHEFAGVIEEVGKDVKTLKTGARVVVPLAQGCGVCDDYRTGHSNHCMGAGMGGYARFGVLSHADYNYAPLPDKIDFVEASAMGCRYVTAFHAILDQGQVKADETVVVYGCGGVGLSAIQITSALGARVIAVDLDDGRWLGGVRVQDVGLAATADDRILTWSAATLGTQLNQDQRTQLERPVVCRTLAHGTFCLRRPKKRAQAR